VGTSPHAQETHPYLHSGPSKRKAHPQRVAQFGSGSTGGQPHGERSRQSSKLWASRQTCRGLIQATGVRGIGVSVGPRTRSPQPSHASDARPWLAPVRRAAPRHAPALAHGGGSAALKAWRLASVVVRPLTRRRIVGGRRPRACGAGDRRHDPGERLTLPGHAPCRASSRGAPATFWPAHFRGGTSRLLRRKPT
jgi:hypothetical protein